jgi:hypothetical protein
VTYYGKGLKESYNFVVGSISNRTHMQELCSHKFFNTITPKGTWLLPKGARLEVARQGAVPLGSNYVSLKNNYV